MRDAHPSQLVVQLLLVLLQLAQLWLQVGAPLAAGHAAKQRFPRRAVYPQADPEICVVLISAGPLPHCSG